MSTLADCWMAVAQFVFKTSCDLWCPTSASV